LTGFWWRVGGRWGGRREGLSDVKSEEMIRDLIRISFGARLELSVRYFKEKEEEGRTYGRMID